MTDWNLQCFIVCFTFYFTGEIQAYEEVYQEDQLRIKMALKRLDKEINWLKYYGKCLTW